MAAFTDAYWTVKPFGLQDADLGEFAEEHLLFVHPRSGRLYAQPAELMAFVRRAIAERSALLGGEPVQRPMLRRRHWRERLVSLPVM
jgi:hypothetical protein